MVCSKPRLSFSKTEAGVSREPEGSVYVSGTGLTAEQSPTLWQLPRADILEGKRDRAMLAVFLGCGLRRRELAELTFDHLQQREHHWAVVDLVAKRAIFEPCPFQTR